MSKLARTIMVLTGATATVVVSAAGALANYPPPSKPHVKGNIVHRAVIDPGRSLAFTGADLLPLLAAVVILLVAGAALLYWSRRRRTALP